MQNGDVEYKNVTGNPQLKKKLFAYNFTINTIGDNLLLFFCLGKTKSMLLTTSKHSRKLKYSAKLKNNKIHKLHDSQYLTVY